MISFFNAKNFKAVPFLETSSLMQSHPNGIEFSNKKPNAIVGPNGSGKSALLQALAIQTLSWLSGKSTLDDRYVVGGDSGDYWTRERPYGSDYVFLQGMSIATDNAPALYFRPNHIPGNDDNVTTAMMCGYFDQAREYDLKTHDKSSGQKSQAMLEAVMAVVRGESQCPSYGYNNWRAGKESKDIQALCGGHRDGWMRNPMPWDYTAEILKNRMAQVQIGAVPVVLMDEPEQSLDAMAEMKFWRDIDSAVTADVQIIIATHSLYPLMFPNRFNLIEASPDYIEQVKKLMPVTT